jgi:ADP-ribosylglycohydrolase
MLLASLPKDHAARMERALLALDGLSVGDAFGNNIFDPNLPDSLHRPRPLPPGPWRYTDDTVMALGIVEVLGKCGSIDQDELVRVFVRRYLADPNRCYGPNTVEVLRPIQGVVPLADGSA